MGCRIVPAVFTGNADADNRSNTARYLALVEEGTAQGFCPVLVDRNIEHYIWEEKYGFADTKVDYPKVTKRLVDLATDSCFSVWLGRLIYNYYLDSIEYEDDAENHLTMLVPPTEREYLDKFSKEIKQIEPMFGQYRENTASDFSFENHVFALVPVKNPWEVLAWIPMGGFNWCPDELHQIGLAKGLYEKFGARIMYISYTALEYYIPDALVEKENVEAAAKILIAADNDIYQDYDTAADEILGRHSWFLWWD